MSRTTAGLISFFGTLSILGIFSFIAHVSFIKVVIVVCGTFLFMALCVFTLFSFLRAIGVFKD